MATVYHATNRKLAELGRGTPKVWSQEEYDAMKKAGWLMRYSIEKREVPEGPSVTFEPPELKTNVPALVRDIANETGSAAADLK